MRSATSEHVSLSDVSRKDAERATLVASRGLHRGLHHMLIRDLPARLNTRIQAKSL